MGARINIVKEELHRLIDESENNELLEDFLAMIEHDKKGNFPENWGVTKQQYATMLEEGERDIQEGRFIAHEEIVNRYGQRKTKK